MLKLSKASNRNTQSHWVNVAGVRVLFSYETPVAFSYGPVHVRIKNHWGPTTGRHMKEAYVSDYTIIDDEEFEKQLAISVWDAATKQAPKEVKGLVDIEQ